MYDLPIKTHRNLIEPVSQAKHFKFVLLEWFFGFLNQVQKSKKQVPKQLLNFIANDVRSTTGSNLCNLLLLTSKDTIEEITSEDIKKLKYHQIDENEIWKVNFIKELTDLKFNQLEVEDFSREELDDILSYLCTS